MCKRYSMISLITNLVRERNRKVFICICTYILNMGYTVNRKQRASGVYVYLVKPYREKGKMKTDQIYLGKEEVANKILAALALKKLEHEKVLNYSGEIILSKIADRLDLVEMINQQVTNSTEFDCGELLKNVIVERILHPRSKWALANKVYKRSVFAIQDKIAPSQFTEDNIYNYMDYLYPQLHSIQVRLLKNLQTSFQLQIDELILDATSIYFYIEDPIEMEEIDLVPRYGYSRDHRADLKQINLMLGVNQDYIPLFFDSFAGNTADVAMFQQTLHLLQTIFISFLKTIKNKYLVMDNGNISAGKFKTIVDLDQFCQKHEVHFIAGLKRNKVKAELLAMKLNLENPIFQHEKTELFGYCIEKKLYGVQRKVLLYYNPKTQQREKKSFETKLARLKVGIATINQDEELTLEVKRERIETLLRNNSALRLFKREERGDQVKCTVKKDEKATRLQLCGKTAIFSDNLSLTAEEMIRLYKAKSKVEHEFKLLKNTFSIRAVNHRKPTRIKTHVAIVIWGIMLVALLKYVLKQNHLEYSFETLIEVLKEGYLETGIFTHPDLNKKLQISRVKNISKELNTIFSLLGLTINELEINQLAHTNQKKLKA